MRYFQAELFSRFLPSSYAGHVNLVRAKPSRFMLNCKYGSNVEIIIFRVQYLFSAYDEYLLSVSNIMIIL